MNPIKAIVRSALTLGLGCCCVWPLAAAPAVESDASIPAVIQAGFDNFQKGQAGIGPAIDAWRKGGLVGQNLSSGYFNSFRDAQSALGSYKSYEWITTKRIGASSKIMYLSINYERGAVFARFLLYRGQDWVVQSMDFNYRPEALMPWLAMEQG